MSVERESSDQALLYAGSNGKDMRTNDNTELIDYLTTKERRSRSAQFLLCGTVSALTGLFFSLFLLVYRVNCDFELFVLGSYVTKADGKISMCKSSIARHPISLDDSFESRTDSPQTATIPGAYCSVDADCLDAADGMPAFCSGGPDGPDGLAVKDYCSIGAGAGKCLCKTIIYDCGIQQYFAWPYKGNQVIDGCTDPLKCSVAQTASVQFWKIDRGWSGCESLRKTTLSDVLLSIQGRMESQGIFQPLKDASDEVWNPVRKALATTADVKFNFYWPSTISESVSRAMSPEAKIFLGFMLLGSLMLLASNYAYECETVSLPHRVLPVIGVNWDTARALLPPSGLILLSLVPMKPESQIFNICDVAMTGVHLVGAQFCFVAYLVCEGDALIDKDNVAQMHPRERYIRGVLVAIGGCSMATFGIIYGILMLFAGGSENPHVTPPFGGRSDLYTADDQIKKSYLTRTAEGPWKIMKMFSYIAEFLVALSILISHLVIWYFYKKFIDGEYPQEEAEDDLEESDSGTADL